MAGRIISVQNFLVPANGNVGTYVIDEVLVAGVPLYIDFREVNLDGQSFWPYGLFVNNINGTQDVAVTIDQMGLTMTTGPGDSNSGMYPGPMDQTVTITGDGRAIIVFCNFPVFSVFG